MSVKILLFAIFIFLKDSISANLYDDSINFNLMPKSGSVKKYDDQVKLQDLGCNPSGLWAIIIPGWKDEPSQSSWVPTLAANLNKYRGGCVLVMDYYNYSKAPNYFVLVKNFPGISAVLLKKVNQLLGEGFSGDKGFIFGFSFGAHLAFDVGVKTDGQIERIDACDSAGPGFNNKKEMPKMAAKNVQCINTSINYGTTVRKCHQNWLMGGCGITQLAVGTYTEHELCPHFYNSAFVNNFRAEANPMKCIIDKRLVAKNYPENYKMGYMETRHSQVNGILFSRTYKTPNYASNLPSNFTSASLETESIAAV